MSDMSEKAAKPYPENMIKPEEFPDTAPPEHPQPWKFVEAGNGHFYLFDANGVHFAHVYCWDGKDMDLLGAKLEKITGNNPFARAIDNTRPLGTEGLVTVMSGGKVLMKVIAGDNGEKAQKLADRLEREWPQSISQAYEAARKCGFGCRHCLVVLTEGEGLYKGDRVLESRYGETFQQPEFNPRWPNGKAEHVVVIEVSEKVGSRP